MKKTAQKNGTAQTPLALLGGLSAAQFLRRHWQKKPLLIRKAIADFVEPLSPREVLDLSTWEDAESRLVARSRDKWTLQEGPLTRRHFATARNAKWTVLVQDIQHFSAEAHELLARFKFIPYARIDDLMVSYAVKGAGVGPHVDSYDVFLLQGSGRRRWRISSQKNHRLAAGTPLKILSNFRAEQEFVLERGDMLYLPPGYSHDGIAETDCLTWSIGFRAPSQQDLGAALLDFLRDELSPGMLYCDPDLLPATHPAEITKSMRQRVRKLLVDVQVAALDPTQQLRCLGRHLTDPKPHIFFEQPVPALTAGAFRKSAIRQGVMLDLKTRFLYSGDRFFMNGHEFQLEGVNASLFRQLADNRHLPADTVTTASDKAFQSTLYGAYSDGFLHVALNRSQPERPA